MFLGLIPGWGGAWLLPNLIGIENALEVIISNPLKNNRMLKGPQAFELGIADAMFGPANFLEDSLKWADGVLGGSIKVKRPNEPGKLERAVKWDIAIGIAEKTLKSRIGTVAKSPYAALELLKAAKNTDKKTGFAAEDKALADLVAGDQFRASIYAFNLVQKRAKRPAGTPDKELAKKITKVGVIGAGLMASQFALLFVRRLQVPVVITDLDQARVDKGLDYIRGEIDALLEKGRIGSDEANQLKALVRGTTDKADFADCDWVIEAVFEELGIKQDVFAEVEQYLADDAILATNTSSLNVEQIGAKLKHPERLVGFHFFNPVAVMPLIEVVKTPKTSDAALSTAMVVAGKLRKNAVITADTPGFVVNRILAKLLGEAMHAVEQGTPVRDRGRRGAAARPADGPVRAARAGRPEGRRPRARHAPRGLPGPLLREPRSARARRVRQHPPEGRQGQGHRLRQEGRGDRREAPSRRREAAQRVRAAGAGRGRSRRRDQADAGRRRRLGTRGHRPLHDPRRGLAVPDGRRDPLPRPGRGERASLRRHLPPPAHPRRGLGRTYAATAHLR